MEQMTVEERLAQPDHCQDHWYQWITPLVNGVRVLDVGAGTGYGIDILRTAGGVVAGIDPLPLREDITSMDVHWIPPRLYDVVTVFDVIEHVDDAAAFLADCIAASRGYVAISTPNWNCSCCLNPFHVCEYTPAEFASLLSGLRYRAWHATNGTVSAVSSLEDVFGCNMAVLIDVREHGQRI